MRPDEFLRALHLLPTALHARALPLRSYVRRTACEDCLRIGDAVTLALTAVHYDETGSAEQLLDTAERLAAEHGTACRPQPDQQRGRGRVGRWAAVAAPVVAATDASWKGRVGGIAYAVSDGHYGLRGRGTGRLDPSGASRVLINELRAVDFLLSAYEQAPAGMTVLLDSTVALRWLRRWQAGEVTAMPAGYSLRPRRWSEQPTLVRLAEQVSRRTCPSATSRGTAGTPSTRPPTACPTWPGAGSPRPSTCARGRTLWWRRSSRTGTPASPAELSATSHHPAANRRAVDSRIARAWRP